MADKNKTKEYPFLLSDFLGTIAYCAVRQSPYDCGPENLQQVLGEFANNSKAYMHRSVGTYHTMLTRQGLKDFLATHLESIQGFRHWNLTKVEIDQGITDPDSEDRPVKFSFTSSHGGPAADHDFIDLDALLGNVARDMLIRAQAEE